MLNDIASWATMGGFLLGAYALFTWKRQAAWDANHRIALRLLCEVQAFRNRLMPQWTPPDADPEDGVWEGVEALRDVAAIRAALFEACVAWQKDESLPHKVAYLARRAGHKAVEYDEYDELIYVGVKMDDRHTRELLAIFDEVEQWARPHLVRP